METTICIKNSDVEHVDLHTSKFSCGNIATSPILTTDIILPLRLHLYVESCIQYKVISRAVPFIILLCSEVELGICIYLITSSIIMEPNHVICIQINLCFFLKSSCAKSSNIPHIS
ncbi:hypothetical protein K469DRAFT_255698 [Zopfia rhizophila CBS 207.26]|uniref:Uncharacterized protein n=1 Tax=Zopfia rhizophila CBS 207.26 TaxID=1314779 RepID=A0A6A6DVJ6_9PEZI|nr:hypothetical protein K469DRAFT_255698 [Zopfia rhizophila CBS 207.26]